VYKEDRCDVWKSDDLHESETAEVTAEAFADDVTGDESVLCVDKVTVNWKMKVRYQMLEIMMQGTQADQYDSNRQLQKIFLKFTHMIGLTQISREIYQISCNYLK
jgi:hypothetical protein